MKWKNSLGWSRAFRGCTHRGGNSYVSLRGFTLVEVLVASAILTIILGILIILTSATGQSIRASNQVVDAAAQSRIAFDRIKRDLAGIVKRTDVDFQAQNPPSGSNNNILLFFSSIASASTLSSNNRGVSLVGYRVATSASNGNRLCLVRAGMPVGWNSSGSMVATSFMGLKSNGLPTAILDIPTALQPSNSDFDVLSAGTIRMVVGFQLYPDNRQVVLSDGSSLANAIGQIVYQPPVRKLIPVGGGTAMDYVDLNRVSAIVVGLITADLRNLSLLNSAQMTQLSNAFPTPTGNNPPIQSWGPIAENVAGFPASIPLSARQAMRVFQCFFPVTSFTKRTWNEGPALR